MAWMKHNPAFLDPAHRVQQFVIRTDELETLVRTLLENDGAANQHVLVLAPRGRGKTMLVHRLVDEIRQDPTLAAKLLALANSAAFGLPRKVDNLDNAMRLVGLSRIRTLALSACLHNAFSMPDGIDGTDFWRYSMDCAGYAQWLAGGLDDKLDVDNQRAWLIGLMLRLGELLIANARPETIEAIEKAPCAPGERCRITSRKTRLP